MRTGLAQSSPLSSGFSVSSFLYRPSSVHRHVSLGQKQTQSTQTSSHHRIPLACWDHLFPSSRDTILQEEVTHGISTCRPPTRSLTCPVCQPSGPTTLLKPPSKKSAVTAHHPPPSWEAAGTSTFPWLWHQVASCSSFSRLFLTHLLPHRVRAAQELHLLASFPLPLHLSSVRAAPSVPSPALPHSMPPAFERQREDRQPVLLPWPPEPRTKNRNIASHMSRPLKGH